MIALTARQHLLLRKRCHIPIASARGRNDTEQQKTANYMRSIRISTTEEKNLSFYQHHGFQVVVTAIEPQSQLRFWAMRRSPRTSS
jgi:hypothetical protein